MAAGLIVMSLSRTDREMRKGFQADEWSICSRMRGPDAADLRSDGIDTRKRPR
jgi:hypothetical protein